MSRREEDQQGATQEYKVNVLYDGKKIGSGKELDAGHSEGVSGTYVWPALGTNAVPFCFYANLLPGGTCTFVFAWPGIVREPIVTENAKWSSLPKGFRVSTGSCVVTLMRDDFGFFTVTYQSPDVLEMLRFEYAS